MMTENRLIWFKGELIPSEEALVPVLSPTAQFGLNVFEGIRGYWSTDAKDVLLFRLPEHLKRLETSCRLIGILPPKKSFEITQAIRDVIIANDYECDVALRVTLFVDGEGSWSSRDPIGMFIAPISKTRRDVANPGGMRAAISTYERIDDKAMPPRVKTGANYINGRYAHLEVQASGYDLPILLDRAGKVSEGAGSCIMMLRDGVLVTPTNSSSVLESITRDTILKLARRAGLQTDVRTIDRTELYIAEEVFLCGSAVEITPLISIDRYIIGDGTAGPVTRQLLKAYFRAVEGEFAEWTTSVWRSGKEGI